MNIPEQKTNLQQRPAQQGFNINIIELLQEILKHALLIILVTAIALVGGYIVSKKRIPPRYTATATMYVNNLSNKNSGSNIINYNEVAAASRLVGNYIVIMKMRPTLQDVIDNLGLPYGTEQLKGMITAASVNNTEIFEVHVTSTDPQEAAAIANEITEVLPQHIADVMIGASVKTVENASVPRSPSSPNHKKNALKVGAIAFIAMCAIFALRYILDANIHDEKYLTQNYDIPVLAVIPDLTSEIRGGYYYAYYDENYGNDAHKGER